MKHYKLCFSLFVATVSFALIGCSTESPDNATPALFNTRAEAEKASENFNCTGAHKMGEKWMPCKSHKAHEDNKKHGGHGNHHNH